MLKRRQEQIKSKGFNMIEAEDSYRDPIEFAKMQVGLRKIADPILNLGSYRTVNPNYGDKAYVLNAIYRHDYDALREISNYFYESSGIYYRLCRYMATLYRYDWYVTPYLIKEDVKEQKILKDFSNVLSYLDNTNIKRAAGDIALNVMRDGVYYGMILDLGDRAGLQKLPPKYCRCRYYGGTLPIIELNLQFFDAYFSNVQYRIKVLKTFPKEIQQAYVLYKQGKLKGDYPGDRSYWYPFEAGAAIKISINDTDFPPFVGVIPAIIDLDLAQDLDRKKTMQQLLKIIVQKLPLDKNGDLIFDVDEAKDIHNNAVAMLKRAIGVDVLTTFADIDKIDTKDSASQTTKDDLEKVERTVYNASGVTKNIFNADGNLAVTNSILTDEASIRDMILQLEDLINVLIKKFNTKSGYSFRAQILQTTQFNYKEMSKLYKDQAQMGYDKWLPPIALGQSQSSVLASMIFQNDVLHLAELMIPPMTSNVQSAKNLEGNSGENKQSSQSKNQSNQTKVEETTTTKETGRPEKEDSEKSDKTIANKESQS